MHGEQEQGGVRRRWGVGRVTDLALVVVFFFSGPAIGDWVGFFAHFLCGVDF